MNSIVQRCISLPNIKKTLNDYSRNIGLHHVKTVYHVYLLTTYFNYLGMNVDLEKNVSCIISSEHKRKIVKITSCDTYSAPETGMQQLVRCWDCCLERSTVSSTKGRSNLASSRVHASTAAPKAASTLVASFAEVSTSGGLPFSEHQA